MVTTTRTHLLATLTLLSACSRAEPDPRTEPPMVRTAVAGDAASSTSGFTGVVSARVQSDLGFRVPGKVIERLVDAGQSVRRGQLLLRMDPTDLTLATAVQAGAVASARAKALQTAADEKRYRDLVAAGAVSASAYDQVKAAADAARAVLNAAQAQSRVTSNEAGYSVLRADADGIVVETLAEPGQVVSAGQAVVRLAHAGPREALVNLPETIRPAIGSFAKASVFHSDIVGEARLRELSSSADPQTRTYAARYVLSGEAARAPLGATVKVTLADLSQGRTLRVPVGAVIDLGRGTGIWTLPPGKTTVKWQPVHVASIGDEEAVVSSGLSQGQRFVALGAHLLHEGQAVRTAPAEGAAR